MAYNEKLADRVREIIALTHEDVEEKKMFSGICFMVNDKMCVGLQKDRLMVRLDPDMIEKVLEKEGCTPMDMRGKVMKGFVLVEEAELTTKKKLEYWLKLALDYNPIAKAAKKKKK
ncbi:MAG: TfoX/Sxy family protein [Ferruginibacter sp.]